MKMDWLRTSLIAGIAVLSFLLVIRWNDFQERNQPIPSVAVTESSVPVADNDIPDMNIPSATSSNGDDIPSLTTVTSKQKQVHVKTDVLEVLISLEGGDIVKVALPTFFAKIDTPDDPYVLLQQTREHEYVAKSGLVGVNGTDVKNKPRPVFSTMQKEYTLTEGKTQLSVDLVLQQDDSTTITKRYTFTKGSHLIDIEYIINNGATTPWQGNVYGQIKRDSYNPVKAAGLGMQPFLGAATTTTEKNYLKMDFGDLADESLKHKKVGGWVAMVQHYFLTAWIPAAEETNTFDLYKSKTSDIYYLQFSSPTFTVAPGSQVTKSFSFYAGPKDIKKLEKISPYLDLTVDYSFLWWIAKPLFYGLDAIHNIVGNWGLAIILLTVVIKILFFYPSAASYRSMAKMRKIQPKMAELKERYGEDRQKFSAEMMKMYKQEKVNPLGGCLPIVIQMPVFLALYWVLMESVDLRQAPFIFWLQDLSVKDPFYILPLIMGLTMFIQQKLNPTPPDPMQAKIMQMMPIFFTFLFLFFPAGLVLYWVVNNSLSITQQYFITKRIERQP